MPSRPLTVKALEAAKAAGKRVEIPDGAQPGLYLIVQPSGHKSFAVRYRIDKRTRKLTLGTFPMLSLAAARQAAFAALQVAQAGKDPARLETEAGAGEAKSAGAALNDFVKRHVSQKRPSTAAEMKRQIEKHLRPAWGERPLGSISRADVLAVLDAAMDAGHPYLANRLFATIRKFFNWSVERGIVAESPTSRMRPPAAERSRERILSHAEIRLLWEACTAVGWPWGDLAKLLLLTGQRREELAGATWAEFDLDAPEPMWLIPRERAKNDRAHLVPLSPAAVALLRGLKRVEGKGNFIFSTDGETRIAGFSKGKARIDAAMREGLRREDPAAVLAPWRLHDLRRTAVSGMAALGQPVHVVEAVINHRSGSVSGVAAVYNVYDYRREKRAALLEWADAVARITAPRRGANIVPMRVRP